LQNGWLSWICNAPYVAGEVTSATLKGLKVPSPIANSVGTGVETVGTIIEAVGDIAGGNR